MNTHTTVGHIRPVIGCYCLLLSQVNKTFKSEIRLWRKDLGACRDPKAFGKLIRRLRVGTRPHTQCTPHAVHLPSAHC